MNWHSRRGRIRLMLIALLTALAVFIPAGAALAAGPPGEASSWTPEVTDSGDLQTPNAPSEAYGGNGGALLQVWRGDNNGIYLSLGHGPDVQMGTTTPGIAAQTIAAPRVVAYGDENWAVFQTGIDGQIWWTVVGPAQIQAAETLGNPYLTVNWQALPGTTTLTTLSPAVTASGPGSTSVLVTYRSSTNTQLYQQWWDGDRWLPPGAIPNAFSLSSPAVVWNEFLQLFVMFFRGTNNQLYFALQPYGGDWSAIQGFAVTPELGSAPAVMALSNGDMQIAMRSMTNTLWYLEWYANNGQDNGGGFSSFTPESTGVDIDTPPQLSGTQGNTIWTLIAYAGYAYYKVSMRESNLPNNLTTGSLSAKRAAFVRDLTSAAIR